MEILIRYVNSVLKLYYCYTRYGPAPPWLTERKFHRQAALKYICICHLKERVKWSFALQLRDSLVVRYSAW